MEHGVKKTKVSNLETVNMPGLNSSVSLSATGTTNTTTITIAIIVILVIIVNNSTMLLSSSYSLNTTIVD